MLVNTRRLNSQIIWSGCCALLLVQTPAALAAQTIRVVSRVPVNLSLSGRPLGEPHLAVHPTNFRHLLGAAMVHDPSARLGDSTRSRIRCVTFASVDGGATWNEHLFDLPACFDPWVAITTEGRAVFSALGSDTRFPGSDDVLVVHHSPDGGITWDAQSVALGRGHDHPMIVADHSSPERPNWVYVVSSLMARADHATLRFGLSVLRSRNGGRTFDPLVYLRPTTLMALAETPVVLSDGTLLVSYVEPALGDGRTKLPRRRAWVVTSGDGGFAFSPPLFINEACGSDTLAFALSALAVDASGGSSRDRLYFTCNQASPPELVVSTSENRGDSWTAARPITHPDTAVNRKVMASAVNARGVFGVAWKESGRNPAEPCAEDVYFSASVHGGDTFLPPVQIADNAACVSAAANGQAFSGDYFGLATGAQQRFLLLWSGVREGLLQLFLATIEVGGGDGQMN